MRRSLVLLGILGLGLTGVWVHAAQQVSSPERSATPPPAQTFNPANFTGTVTPRNTSDIRMNRYHFDPGARTKWHSHEAGQVIYVEEGRLRVQERGKAAATSSREPRSTSRQASSTGMARCPAGRGSRRSH